MSKGIKIDSSLAVLGPEKRGEVVAKATAFLERCYLSAPPDGDGVKLTETTLTLDVDGVTLEVIKEVKRARR